MDRVPWDPAVDGPLSEAALRRKLERLGYSVTRYVYPPGTYFPDHSHDVDKMDAVLSGRFRLVVEGHEVIMEAGTSWLSRAELFTPLKS